MKSKLFFFIAIAQLFIVYSVVADDKEQIPPLFQQGTLYVAKQVDSTIAKDIFVGKINVELKQSVIASAPKQFSMMIPLTLTRTIQADVSFAVVSFGELKVIDVARKSSIIPPKCVCYRGKIRGNTKSLVAVMFSELQIVCVVSDSTGNYTISKFQNDVRDNSYVIVSGKNLTLPNKFHCGYAKSDMTTYDGKKKHRSKSSPQLQSDECRSLKIDFYCDFGLYTQFGSSTNNVTEYIVALSNVVGAIYAIEGIHMTIGIIQIFTTNDPFSNTNINDALSQLRDYIENNGYVGNLVHLLSTGGLGGLAPGGTSDLCDSEHNDDDACSVSMVDGVFEGTYGNIPLYEWDIEVVAHEIGHNLGSAHTHSYNAWNGCQQIDNCMDDSDPALADNDKCTFFCFGCSDGPMPGTNGGTIMSYCHLTGRPGISFANGFGWQPGNKIRDTYNDAWDCLEIYPLDWRTQNDTHSSPTLQYYGRFIFAGNNVLNNHPQGPVIMNFSTGSTTWQTGRAIYLKAGFHKTNTGTFKAKIIQLLDCYSQYSIVTSNEGERIEGEKQSTHTTASTLSRVNYGDYIMADGVHILPNPANTEIAVLGKDITEIEIYTSFGSLVLSVNSDYSSINISQLAQGTYYIRCTTPQGVIVKPFVIVR